VADSFHFAGSRSRNRVLGATCRGGFWAEEIAEPAKEATSEKDVLAVLTGRTTDFSDLIPKMLQSKQLKFDLIVMKPTIEDRTILQYKFVIYQSHFIITVVLRRD
jgi:hypothetical protein